MTRYISYSRAFETTGIVRSFFKIHRDSIARQPTSNCEAMVRRLFLGKRVWLKNASAAAAVNENSFWVWKRYQRIVLRLQLRNFARQNPLTKRNLLRTTSSGHSCISNAIWVELVHIRNKVNRSYRAQSSLSIMVFCFTYLPLNSVKEHACDIQNFRILIFESNWWPIFENINIFQCQTVFSSSLYHFASERSTLWKTCSHNWTSSPHRIIFTPIDGTTQ